jgi:hypothetical protein
MKLRRMRGIKTSRTKYVRVRGLSGKVCATFSVNFNRLARNDGDIELPDP